MAGIQLKTAIGITASRVLLVDEASIEEQLFEFLISRCSDSSPQVKDLESHIRSRDISIIEPSKATRSHGSARGDTGQRGVRA